MRNCLIQWHSSIYCKQYSFSVLGADVDWFFDPWHVCGLFFPFFGGVEDLKNAIMCCCSFDEHFWLQWWEQMHRCELWAVRSFQVNCNETLFKTIHSLNGIFWFACVFLFLLFSQFLNWKLSTYLQANQDKKGIRLFHRI